MLSKKNAKILIAQNGTSGNDTLIGKDQEDTVDVLYGLEGDDVLKGNAYDDELHGGAGNDLLEGGAGNDVYKFARGFGEDTIITATSQGHADGEYVEFTDIESTEVTLGIDSANKNDLIISVNNTDDSIRVKDYFSSPHNYLDNIVFSDRVLWNKEEIMKQVQLVFNGTNNDDQLEGYTEVYNTINYSETFHGKAGNDSILAHKGNDVLYGDEGNDYLDGGEGNDTIYGGEGDDTISGGIENDYLKGGRGNNIYKFSKGFGKDIIQLENTDRSVNTEKLVFTDVKSTEIYFEVDLVNKSNLYIKVRNTEDSIKVLNFFSSIESYIDSIEFSDDVIWGKSDIDININNSNLSTYGTVGSDVILGLNNSNYIERIYGLEGNDKIRGLAGNDYFFGNEGKDDLYGGVGNDNIMGNSGIDKLYGGENDDILNGGSENDYLYGETGNDVLVGDDGNDYLNGGMGNDVYKFEKGFGQDTIQTEENNVHLEGENIEFTNIESTEVYFEVDSQDYNNIYLKVTGTTDTIKILNYRSSNEAYIDSIKFSDGIIWGKTKCENEMDAAKLVTDGTMNDDVITGSWNRSLLEEINGLSGNDTIDGLAGDDTIQGGEGSDTLYGNEGDDKLYGGNGNDVLIGGSDDDILVGGSGDDTYKFERGFGQDSIGIKGYNDYQDGENLVFTDIKSTEIYFEVDDLDKENLLIKIRGSSDSIKVIGHYNRKKSIY